MNDNNTTNDSPRTRRMRGFTLLEIVIAVTITAMLVVSVLEVFQVSLFAREEVNALSEPMTTGPRILDMIEEDVEGLWTFNIKDNRVFRGDNRDFIGDDADRIHLIVTGESIHQVRLPDDTFRPAPVAEVSYMVKGSMENAQHLELWRREDPMIDDELYEGGYFQMLSNRVRSFNVTYYEELGQDAEPFDEWDAAEKGTLPRRIKIELAIERSKDTFNKLREVEDIGDRVDKFVRHVVLDPDMVNILNPGIALIPVVPEGPPEAENALAGGGGGTRTRGAGGKGGADRPGGDKTGGGRAGKTGPGTGPNVPFPGPGKGRGASGVNFERIIRDLGGNRGGGGGGGKKGR